MAEAFRLINSFMNKCVVHMENITLSNGVCFGNEEPFVLFAGPCQLESLDHAMFMAEKIKEITQRLRIPFVFKVSFDKANRTSLSGKRGMGLEAALPVFEALRKDLQVMIMTDVHEPWQCEKIAPFVDVLQIPAFLCRQTDLLLAAKEAAGPHHCMVNVKKGQFLAPWDMQNVVEKVRAPIAVDQGPVVSPLGTIAPAPSPFENISVTERGTSFGYNNLVVDMRSLPILAKTTGCPVIFDATHSTQLPGGQGASSGGQREFVETLARAAVAVGVAGIFMEVHEDPDHAPSDGPSMLPLALLEPLLSKLLALDTLVKSWMRSGMTPSKEADSIYN